MRRKNEQEKNTESNVYSPYRDCNRYIRFYGSPNEEYMENSRKVEYKLADLRLYFYDLFLADGLYHIKVLSYIHV